jgi:hypothetical protein
MTADELMQAIDTLCQSCARAHVAHVAAGDAQTKSQYDHLKARADYWSTAARAQYQAIAATVAELLPEPAPVERFMPVRTLPNGYIEIHAHDRQARPVAVLLSGAQALAVGTHLCAYAAVALDRIGFKVNDVLPPVKAAPPFITPGIIPPPTPAPAPDGGQSDTSAYRP